jgi:PAS domain S-box-containing protein
VNISHLPNRINNNSTLETLIRAVFEGSAEDEKVRELMALYQRLQDRAEFLEQSLKALHTERAEHERSIEARYRQLLEAITDYTFTVSVRGTTPVHTKHSANCVAITGYSAQEYDATATLWFEMIHPDDREAALEQSRKILHDHLGEKLEHRIVHKNGSVRWIKNTPVLHLNDNGDLLGYDGLISDITARKEIEMNLRESEERFRFVIELAPIGIKLISPQNRILKANAAFCVMLGYTEQELMRLSTERVTVPEDFARDQEQLQRLMAGELDEIEVEKRYCTRTGETVWANTHSRFLRDDDGKALVRIAIVENITRRKLAEEAVHHSEERLRALMQNANDAVVITDSEGYFTYCSPSVARMFYYSPAMLIGNNAYSYIHDEDLERIKSDFRTLVELPLNAMKTMQYRYRRADGSWAEIEAVSTNLLTHPLIGGIVTNARDISNRHRLGQDTTLD